jgi:mono/diheme cytochrome c family protein
MIPLVFSNVRQAESARRNSGEANRHMLRTIYLIAVFTTFAVLLCPESALADETQVARGKYLVQLAGCTDCHTPGHFTGKSDSTRYLAGSDIGFQVPGAGTFVGPNLTPDPETGLGHWTSEQIAKTLRTGVRPDGRVLFPVMPWPAYARLTPSDLDAIVAFLKSLRPVTNRVPGPFGPNEEPPISVMKLTPPKSTVRSETP